MDWPKIKNILLGLLILANVTLGVMLFIDFSNFYVDGRNQLNTVFQFYEDNGITIQNKEMRFPKGISSVIADFEWYKMTNESLVTGELFDFEEMKSLLGKNMKFQVKERTLSFAKDSKMNRLIYNFAYNPGFRDLNLVKKLVADAAKALALKEDYEAISYNKYQGYLVVEAKQKVDLVLMEESHAYFWFKDQEFVGMKCVNPVKITENYEIMYDIMSLDVALYKNFHKVENKEPIVAISLVYKLNDTGLIGREIVKGEALPYYRIEMLSGKVYYFEALEPVN